MRVCHFGKWRKFSFNLNLNLNLNFNFNFNFNFKVVGVGPYRPREARLRLPWASVGGKPTTLNLNLKI